MNPEEDVIRALDEWHKAYHYSTDHARIEAKLKIFGKALVEFINKRMRK